MAGKHRLAGRRPRTVEVVDAGTDQAHLLTLDALAAGRGAEGRYVALCGADVLPAALVAPPRQRCRSCPFVPAQRSGVSR